ncbi:hypothetical protein BD410DRAFT_796029 [Rickenella mellea]|uniref:BTB domain-containing protein n=1 Tax=Rickenella mellea TaxID=50990 RepID=A0A4Y7PKR8_9AGAM|nr:hypothetical protein BD410DRAFT_796029 [Rickenella mellea]
MASASTPSNAMGTRHEILYLATGDLVLSALSNLKEHAAPVLFRVHKFMLAHHSSIFRDMFAITAPLEDCNESYDGAHVVHMPDSAEDLEGLLKVLYDPTCIPIKCQDFDFVVVGILKLAIKYEIEPVRKHIITQVNDAWPATLQEWDAFERRSEVMLESGVLTPDVFLPEPVLCLEIAKLAPDDVHISFVAFYHLSRTSAHSDFDRQKRQEIASAVLGGTISVLKIIATSS